MILYFRKGARVTELLLAKDTLRPGMLTKGYLFMVIESDARGHIGIMPSEREHFDLEWMANAAFWTRALQRKHEKGQALCQKAHKPRLCAGCGHLFQPNTAKQEYCSIGCQKRYWQEAHRREKKEKQG